MTIEFKLPELGENVESGDVVKVLVSEGQRIEADQPICELETDKAVVEIPCSHAGTIAKIHFQKGDTVKVGQTLLTLQADGEQVPSAERAAPSVEPPSPPTPLPQAGEGRVRAGAGVEDALVPAGPATRRLARQLGVDLRRLQGSGNRGRITPEDVEAAAGDRQALPPAAQRGAPAVSIEPVVPPGQPGHDAWGAVRRERMTKVRQTIAAHMARSASTIPHVTNFDDADVTELESLRKGIPKGYLGANLKLTAMPFVMKAVGVALGRHPMLGASLDEENSQIVYKEYVHLGVAVDTPRGLVVPKVRNVDRMTIPEIARALATVAERARAAQFSVDDLRGGTFTISNLGAVGGTYSTPIINHPEVAVLLVGRSRWMPVVRDGKVETRLMMPLSLSYDHRLVDGATAARFLNEVIDWLQSPGKLLLAE